MATEHDKLVAMLLREIRQEMATKSELGALKSELKSDIADLRSSVKSMRADVASDMMNLEQRLSDRISHLNRAVMEYHSSAVGHGVLISEFEEHLRKVEQHLKLPPHEAH